MSDRQYQVILNNKRIGVTELEKADAPMGVVFGKLLFENISSGYLFLKDYCEENAIGTKLIPGDKFISTGNISDLRVLNSLGTEIKGSACSISGMDAEFEITIEGIPYPFYEEEFPHHVEAYHNQFKNAN